MAFNSSELAGDGNGALDPILPEGDHVDEEMLGEILMLLEDEAPDVLLRTCDLFRKGVRDHIAEIEAALAEGRIDLVARAAHSIRGSAGTFGARRLHQMAERLEALCGEDDVSPAPALTAELRVEFELFRAILDARLAGLSPPPAP